MIAVIDYGMGNIGSIIKAFSYIGYTVNVVKDPQLLDKADKIVLPGVGAFKKAMDNLNNQGMTDSIINQVNKGKSFLGICLGYQLLFQNSDEGYQKDISKVAGLGIHNGNVRKFSDDLSLKIPQIGWNSIQTNSEMKILSDFNGKYFYFVHSYYPDIDDMDQKYFAYTQYGISFPSAVEKDNILACQFHPEKSGDQGIMLLKKWVMQ